MNLVLILLFYLDIENIIKSPKHNIESIYLKKQQQMSTFNDHVNYIILILNPKTTPWLWGI